MASHIRNFTRLNTGIYVSKFATRLLGIDSGGFEFTKCRFLPTNTDVLQSTSETDRLPSLFKANSLLRSKELESAGISRTQVGKLVEAGKLFRVTRGVYAAQETQLNENLSLAVVAKAVPAARICLLSALRFHDLTTQSPHEVWIAIRVKDRKPKIEYPPLRVNRFSGATYDLGVEKHAIEGVPIEVYSAAKTVVDLFRYRRKIGIDVAIEALREGWKERRFSISELTRLAKACRMDRVMTPYLESLIA